MSSIIGCIAQVRMSSNRLPGKALMKLDKKNPVLYYVLKQLEYCKLLDKIEIDNCTLV